MAHGSHLSVVQFEGCVVVVGVVVHPLVHHCHVAIDLLSPFLQWPVLSTFPPTALVCPAAQRQDIFIETIFYDSEINLRIIISVSEKST